MFEWDETKRLIVLEKHGIDFHDAKGVFEGDVIFVTAKSESEERAMAIGPLHGVLISIVFTIRNGNTRLITARRARTNEKRTYHTRFPQRIE